MLCRIVFVWWFWFYWQNRFKDSVPPEQAAAGCWGNPAESLPPQPSWIRHGCSQAAETALAAWVWAHARPLPIRGEVLGVLWMGSRVEEAKGLWLLTWSSAQHSRGAMEPLSPAAALQGFFQNAVFDWANYHLHCWVFFRNDDLLPQCLGIVPHQFF